MVQIEVNIDHLQEMIQDLEKVIGELDPAPLLEDAGAFLLNRIRTRFLAEKDPDGQPWEPSKAAIKRRAKGGTGTLFDTGTLFKSIQFAKTGQDEAVIGTDVEYAPYMHYGFVHHISGQKVGPWPFMGISKDDANTVEIILSKRLQEIIDDKLGEY